MNTNVIYQNAISIDQSAQKARAEAARLEAELLSESKRKQLENWHSSAMTAALLDFLIKREQETLEKAREVRSDSNLCREFLAKSIAYNEILEYARTGKRVI